tara:strand:+ start:744 stop:1463 length:720 start_codon:yes stop_codon:yes gene_type:complete
MLKVLELFSGTGSVSKVCKELGYECLSIDLYLPADINIDILEWDYKKYPKDSFDIIWASPPCVEYSLLKVSNLNQKVKGEILTKEKIEKNMNEADKLVSKALEIIEYFNPHWWFMENPATGRLKNRDVVKGLDWYDVDYCMYCDWGYRKRTRIWTNRKDFEPLKCDGSGDCGNMIEIPTNGAMRHDTGQPIKSATRKLHINNLGNSSILSMFRKMKIKCGTTTHERYRIPPNLIFSLLT